MLIVTICILSSECLKVCDEIRSCCHFFSISQNNNQKMYFSFLHLCDKLCALQFLPKDRQKNVSWHKLGGVRLAWRIGEQEEIVGGREMSSYEESLSKQVVYTWRNSNHIHNNHNHYLQRAFLAVRVSICQGWAVLPFGLIYFGKK